MGVLATAALVGVAYTIYGMVAPDNSSTSSAAVGTPTPTATAKKASHKKKATTKKKAGLTAAQRKARNAAVKDMRAQGFTTTKLSTYNPKAALRVLIGRPVGDSAGGYTAFFFTKSAMIGRDAHQPSTALKVSKKTNASVTLTYGIYKSGDKAGSPSATQDVRFVLKGGVLTPQDAIPLQGVRFQRASG